MGNMRTIMCRYELNLNFSVALSIIPVEYPKQINGQVLHLELIYLLMQCNVIK